MQLIDPIRNEFSFQLEGLDNAWRQEVHARHPKAASKLEVVLSGTVDVQYVVFDQDELNAIIYSAEILGIG